MSKPLILSLLITLAACNGNLKYLEQQTAETEIYSAVISAKKYVNRVEKKIFFAALPFSFKMSASINKSANSIDIKLNNAYNDISNLNVLIETQKLALESNFASLLIFDFSDEPNLWRINLDKFNESYKVENTRWYQNRTFKDLQIKLIHIKSKDVLYITLDFHNVSDAERLKFEKVFINLKN